MTEEKERRVARRTTRIFITIAVVMALLSVVLPLIVHPAVR